MVGQRQLGPCVVVVREGHADVRREGAISQPVRKFVWGGTVLEDFIKFIAQHLVEKPEDVVVSMVEEEDRHHYTLVVSGPDLGRVIGKDGRNAKAMRTLLTASSALRGKRAILEISNESAEDSARAAS